MRSFLVPGLILLAACSTPKGLDPMRLPAHFDVELEREVATDFNGDDIEDSVKLLPATDGSPYHILEISLSDGKGFQKKEIRNFVNADVKPGASLELLDNGSFKILIDNTNAGEIAKIREYTVSFREEKFVLSGVTVSEFHRVDPAPGGSCDINFLTGEGERNSQKVKVKPLNREIASLDPAWLPTECKF